MNGLLKMFMPKKINYVLQKARSHHLFDISINLKVSTVLNTF